MLKNCALKITPRIYQKHAYELMLKNYREKNDNTFHIVAPPGSGKTVLGLLLMINLSQKTLILSPSKTISMQWKRKFDMLAVNPIDNKNCENLISDKIEDSPYILNITYQAFSVKDKDGNLHKNSKRIIIYLIENEFKTIILDECHHLLNYWAEIIKKFIDSVNYTPVIIGLTATPPYDKKNREKKAYLSILGDVDYQVPIPAVVKDGNLAPFRDIAYFVTPEDDEQAFIEEETQKIDYLINKTVNLSKSGKIDLSFNEYFLLFLKNPKYKNEIIPFNELYHKYPELSIATVKYIKYLNLSLPVEIIVYNEMYEDLSEYDYAVLFKEYVYNYEENKNKILTELKKEIIEIWKNIGYGLHKNRITELKSGLLNMVNGSRAKIKAVTDILKNEYDILGEKLKVLIVTDFVENRNFTNVFLGGASGVFIHLSSSNLYDELSPIMITGKKIMIHKKLKGYFNLKFQDKGKFLFSDRIEKVSDILAVVTSLMYENKIKVIIGTKALLGEGYDNIKLNTLIDMTLSSSYVTTNQIRGRVLRKDPEDDYKVSNIWEIINISEQSTVRYHDFKRIEKKHSHFFSLSPNGNIVKGISHLGRMDLSDISKLNEKFLKLALDRGKTFVDWKIGEKYKDINTEKLQITYKEKFSDSKYTNKRVNKIITPDKLIIKENKQSIFMPASMLTTIFLSFAASIYSNISFFYIFSFLSLINGIVIYKRQKILKSNPEFKFIKGCSKVIFYSLKEMGLIEIDYNELIEIRNTDENSLEIIVKDEDLSKIFINSIDEIMQPVYYQKYVIEFKIGKHSFYFPLPSFFGKNRTRADIYGKYWNKYISDGNLIYIKNNANFDKIKNKINKFHFSTKKSQIWF